MAEKQKKPTAWGRPRDFAVTIAVLLVIGVGATFHWRALDLGIALVALASLAVGSVVVLCRAWRHRDEPGPAKLGQAAALPARWRKWMLGEHDKHPK